MLFGLVILVAVGFLLLRGGNQLALSATATPAPTPSPTAEVILTPRPELATGGVEFCRGNPAFPKSVGYPAQVLMSTSERTIMGMAMYSVDKRPTPDNPRNGVYQHPTWDNAGYLGHIVVDEVGNIYAYPAPRVSLIDNPPGQQNTIYRVDTQTGEMKKWLDLPADPAPSSENPFGILGLAYDCQNHTLYASSVQGSSRSQELGRLYHINVAEAKIIGQYESVDAFGMGVFNGSTGKRLYFGSARRPEVRSIALDGQGNFLGAPRVDLSLAGLGPVGDDRARRVLFDENLNLTVRGIEFNFTLVATSEQRQTPYRFGYDAAQDKWLFQGVLTGQ